MRTDRMRRIFTLTVVFALALSTVSFVGLGAASACEEQQVVLPAVARGYDVGTDRFLDGVVTNDTTQTLRVNYVKIGWAEDTKREHDEWICSGPLAPGEWTSFHVDWPCSVPATWTPVAHGYAEPTDAQAPLALTVDSISSATVDEDGVRTYAVTVTNPNAFPVSSLSVVGVERDATSGDFVDTLDACPPDQIAAGASATFDVVGRSPWEGDLTTDLHVTALEQPVITLSTSTTSPAYGSPVAFTLTLTHADGSPALGCRTLKLFSSRNGEDWCDYKCYDTDTGIAIAVVTPDAPRYYKAVYWGGDDLGCAMSEVIFVRPLVTSTMPSVPASIRAHRSFKVSGRMCAGSMSAGKAVVLTTERKRGSRWVKYVKVTARPDSAGRYKTSLRLSSAGTYRIRAYRAGVGYSHYKTLKVRN